MTMACECWKAKLETYVDGECPGEEARAIDAHLRGCPSCSADAFTSAQLKYFIQASGKCFNPTSEFRKRIRRSIASKPQRSYRLGWAFAAVAIVVVGIGIPSSTYIGARSDSDHFIVRSWTCMWGA